MAALTVGELKNMISNMPDDAEVKVAFQPSWPLAYSISGDEYFEDFDKNILWLAEDGQDGYLPDGVSDSIGWNY